MTPTISKCSLLVAGVAMTLGLGSCSDQLDIDQHGTLTTETFYNTDQDAREAATAIYVTMNSNMGAFEAYPAFIKMLLSNDVWGLSAAHDSEWAELVDLSFDPACSFVGNAFQCYYNVVGSCNAVIDNVQPDTPVRAQLVADANPQPLSWLRGGSYKMSLFGFEFDMPTYGQYYNVVDGVNNPVPDIFVTEGTVTVANPHDNYFEITLDNTGLQTATQTPGEVYAKFAGDIAFGPVEGTIPGQGGEEPDAPTAKTYTYKVSTNPEKPLERTIAITDNEGNAAAQFVFFTLADNFEGTYTVAAAPAKAADMSVGMELFGMMLGSYFNADGKNYSLQAGTKVEIVAAADGTLSFHLTNLTASDSAGSLYGQSSYNLDQVKKK